MVAASSVVWTWEAEGMELEQLIDTRVYVWSFVEVQPDAASTLFGVADHTIGLGCVEAGIPDIGVDEPLLLGSELGRFM
jgi:hypothetical protein